MNEPDHSLMHQLLSALADNTKAQTALAQAITNQTSAISDLVEAISSEDTDDDEADTGLYLSGMPRS